MAAVCFPLIPEDGEVNSGLDYTRVGQQPVGANVLFCRLLHMPKFFHEGNRRAHLRLKKGMHVDCLIGNQSAAVKPEANDGQTGGRQFVFSTWSYMFMVLV